MALHHMALKAAVTKYGPLSEGKTKQEVAALLAADDKKYDEEAIGEIIAALGIEEGEKEQPKKDEPKKEDKQEKYNPFAKQHYQEWRVELLNGRAEKLKVVRKRVLITDEQAEVLNNGVLEGGNTYGSMYFKA